MLIFIIPAANKHEQVNFGIVIIPVRGVVEAVASIY